MTTSESTTRLQDYIKELLPWAHGHQLKSIATFVAAILEKQTGNQAELARTQGNKANGASGIWSAICHCGQSKQPKNTAFDSTAKKGSEISNGTSDSPNPASNRSTPGPDCSHCSPSR
jgi:hypothetical protein